MFRALPARLSLVLVIAGLAVTAGTAVGANGTSVVVTDVTVQPGGTTTVDVVLTDAPDGLAGYEMTLTLEGIDAARIAGATYPDGFALTTDPSVAAGSRVVTLEAADIEENVQPGARNVTLATVTVGGESVGASTVTVSDIEADADGGDLLSPTISDGQLSVEAATTSIPTVAEPATTASSTDAPGTPTPTASANGPGFGLLAALVGLLTGTLLAGRD